MDKDKTLEEIFENDPLGLLNVKPKVSARTADELLLSSFEEINTFIDQHDREPDANLSDVMEFKLYSRLKGLREDTTKAAGLIEVDRHKLLPYEAVSGVEEPRAEYKKPKEITSIDDILEGDGFGLLESDAEDLFNFEHTPRDFEMPEYIASRKPCEDFEKFEGLLQTCQQDLANGKRRLRQFRNEQQIGKGSFFVLKGILLYIAEVGDKESDKNNKTNARLRCIFENGTESDMLLRSLAAELYKDGRRVTAHEDHLLDNFHNLTDEDQAMGYIYVLRSRSQDPKIRSLENLYKIGYSRTEIQDRIKNAEKQPTYLMAPVDYIAGWQCYNMNPQKFEQLIHTVFGSACLNIDIFDEAGKRYSPREWFIVPLSIIEQAIEMIINGEIVHYRYDAGLQVLGLRG